MAPPDRRAARRSVEAVAEDLHFVRRAGGLVNSDQDDLASTLELLAALGPGSPVELLDRGRDLLVNHLRRITEPLALSPDASEQASARSLQRLLLREPNDKTTVLAIRRAAIGQARADGVTVDALRKREDRLITAIAKSAHAELLQLRADEPKTIEDAIHRLVPVVSDVRQQLHDGLCLIYDDMPATSPRERIVFDYFYENTVIELGRLLTHAVALVRVGLKTADLTPEDYWFLNHGRFINGFLFDEVDDREFILELTAEHRDDGWKACVAAMQATDRGRAVYDRWVAWAGSCFPTCPFERSTDPTRMCDPHALLSLLYDVEVKYVEHGYADLHIIGNTPLVHHRLQGGTTQPSRGSDTDDQPDQATMLA